MRRHPGTATWAMLVAAASLPPDAGAQAPPRADLPSPQVGDVWRYRTSDLWNGKEVGVVSQRLAQVQDGQYILRAGSGDRERTLVLDRSMAPCYVMNNDTQLRCGGPFAFPMVVGASHAFDKQPWPNGKGYMSQQCKVVAREEVSVPAGRFDTFRIECQGFWTRMFDGTGSGRVQEVLWYAPQVHRSVLSRYETWTSGGAPDTRQQTELLAFVPAGSSAKTVPARPAPPPAQATPASAAPGRSEDADWDARYLCPALRQGGRNLPAVALQFSGVTVGRQFAAQKGVEGQPGWLYLHGKVAADGSAVLQWDGVVDNPATAPQEGAKRGDAYSFTLSVTFAGARAQGQRIDRPECTLTLLRQ